MKTSVGIHIGVHSLVNISMSLAKVGKIHKIMLVAKRRFAYGYYDV